MLPKHVVLLTFLPCDDLISLDSAAPRANRNAKSIPIFLPNNQRLSG